MLWASRSTIRRTSLKETNFCLLLRKLSKKANLPADLIQYATTDEYDTQLRASTAEALDKVGDDVGVPLLAINDVAFFGPVLSPSPHGEEAGKVFDGAVAMASYPGFF